MKNCLKKAPRHWYLDEKKSKTERREREKKIRETRTRARKREWCRHTPALFRRSSYVNHILSARSRVLLSNQNQHTMPTDERRNRDEAARSLELHQRVVSLLLFPFLTFLSPCVGSSSSFFNDVYMTLFRVYICTYKWQRFALLVLDEVLCRGVKKTFLVKWVGRMTCLTRIYIFFN